MKTRLDGCQRFRSAWVVLRQVLITSLALSDRNIREQRSVKKWSVDAERSTTKRIWRLSFGRRTNLDVLVRFAAQMQIVRGHVNVVATPGGQAQREMC